MKSICLACVIYTMNGKDPKENLYLNIFYQWLTMVIKNGGLQSDDILNISIDTRTLEYFNNNSTILTNLLKKLACPFVFYTFDPPNTPLEGMMHKYDNTEYTQDVYIYSDIDVLIVKPFSLLTEKTEENTMYFVKGVSLDHQFYSEGFPPEFIIKDLPGFNASIFIISSSELRDAFFCRINELCDYSTQYKWVEQPYFNRAIYEICLDKVSVNINLLTEYVSFNGRLITDTTVFFDLAGETSNGLYHFTKMSDMICLFLIDELY